MPRVFISNASGCCPKRHALLMQMPRLLSREARRLFCRGGGCGNGNPVICRCRRRFFSSSSSLNNNIFLSFSLSFFIYRGNARKTCFVDSQRISLENLMKTRQNLRFSRDFSPFFVRFSSIFASFLLVCGAFNRVLTKKSQFSEDEKMSFLPVFSARFFDSSNVWSDAEIILSS